jgi:hypothetical protein
MSNTGSDADGFVTNKMFKPVHKYFTADQTRQLVLEDCAWRSSSGEKMIGILPWKNY